MTYFGVCNQTSYNGTGEKICTCKSFITGMCIGKEECMCARDFTKNPITPLSRLNWNVCVCMQNLIYDEAEEFWSASRENCVFFSCVNVRLEPQLPSILEWNREASNQNEVHKSECDKPTACVCNYCISSGYRAVSSNRLFNNRIAESLNL